ncbi:hypothetical protein [Mycobacterium sp. ITM-2016-00318]|uniref:hypothetical protein n=1 Tax=Mycobacterium sp. ITM-2016-00318 TaxID=2099693 RepID=UPI000CF9D99E|nr:hypothetical protein [Mycobacterium sp. ITM-2016-00318]WNG95290.1 hypothetical protein C6A82_013160 [Mycobacterium sp. ITM-2016-00318]
MTEQQLDENPVEDTTDEQEGATDERIKQAPEEAPAETDETEADSFSRAYVEQLRQENGKYRQRAQRADELAHRLHNELVRSTGRLADPADLPFSEDHLDDPGTLTSAIEDLVARKPHLAARRPAGQIGQGVSASPATVDLAAILRNKAG